MTLSLGLSTAAQAVDSGTPAGKDQPARFNKATGIVGMEVKNPDGERLGQIKDIVFDLKSERVAYAVLGTATSPGKLLAVPISALTPSANGEQLVLHASRASLEAAKGFAADNWPAAVSPVWAAQPAYASAPAPHVSLPHR